MKWLHNLTYERFDEQYTCLDDPSHGKQTTTQDAFIRIYKINFIEYTIVKSKWYAIEMNEFQTKEEPDKTSLGDGHDYI